MLADRMKATNANCWLVNTGWVGGKFGIGSRCSLKYTRAIVDAIHNGSLAALPEAEYDTFSTFGLSIPTKVEGVPAEILDTRKAWPDKDAFHKEVKKLAKKCYEHTALHNENWWHRALLQRGYQVKRQRKISPWNGWQHMVSVKRNERT